MKTWATELPYPFIIIFYTYLMVHGKNAKEKKRLMITKKKSKTIQKRKKKVKNEKKRHMHLVYGIFCDDLCVLRFSFHM